LRYQPLGRTGLYVSQACMGTMTFGGITDPAEAQRIVDRCLDVGINFFDTADVYAAGRSEEILGKALTGRREAQVIATKAFSPTGRGPNDMGLSRKHLIAACEASLRRLGTDYIDLYQVHADDCFTPLEETLSALDQLVRQGKVRYVGASNYGAWRLCEALWISETRGFARYQCLQPLYNLIERGIDTELLPLCREKGVAVIAWSPLAGGWLTGKYRGSAPPEARLHRTQQAAMGQAVDREKVLDALFEAASRVGALPAQVALRWVLDQEGISCAILGARDVAQFEQNLGAFELRLEPELWQRLEQVSALPLIYPSTMARAVRRRREAALNPQS
jgi:aryl-alcohol dehydrogenase-like predicted oxidoreductase